MPSGTYTYFIVIFSDDITVATLPHPPIMDPPAIMGQFVLHGFVAGTITLIPFVTVVLMKTNCLAETFKTRSCSAMQKA
jgi:hypothetical protein